MGVVKTVALITQTVSDLWVQFIKPTISSWSVCLPPPLITPPLTKMPTKTKQFGWQCIECYKGYPINIQPLAGLSQYIDLEAPQQSPRIPVDLVALSRVIPKDRVSEIYKM